MDVSESLDVEQQARKAKRRERSELLFRLGCSLARHQEPEPQTTELLHRGRVHSPSTLGSPRYHLVQGPVPSGTVMIRTDCEFHRAEEDGSFFSLTDEKGPVFGTKTTQRLHQTRQLSRRNCTAETIALQPSISQPRLQPRRRTETEHARRSNSEPNADTAPRDFRESQRMRRQSAAVSPKYCTTKTWWLGNPEAENWRTGRVQVATPPVTEVRSSHGNNTLQAGVGMYVGT